MFATGRGSRLAWRTFTWPSTQQLNLSVVDAATGAVLYRQSLSRDATGSATAWEFYPATSCPRARTARTPSRSRWMPAGLYGDNATGSDLNDNNSQTPAKRPPP